MATLAHHSPEEGLVWLCVELVIVKFHLPRNRRDHRMAGLFPSLLLLLVPLSLTALAEASPSSTHDKFLPDKIAKELAGYQDVVEQIVDYAVNGPGQNQSYDRLATFTDAFGSRLSGTYIQ